MTVFTFLRYLEKSRAKNGQNIAEMDAEGPWTALRESRATFNAKMAVAKALSTALAEAPVLRDRYDVDWLHALLPFGSTMSGFALEGADLDVVLISDEIVPIVADAERKKKHAFDSRKITALKLCKEVLNGLAGVKYIEIVAARVPVLRFQVQPRYFGVSKAAAAATSNSDRFIQVELSLANRSEGAQIRNTHLLASYAFLDPRVWQLTALIKAWARRNDLVSSYDRLLSGYGIVLLVVFYMQSKDIVPCLQSEYPETFKPSVPVVTDLEYDFEEQKHFLFSFKSVNRSKVSELYTGFFSFYDAFDFASLVVSVRTGAALTRAECAEAADGVEAKSGRDWFSDIAIEDPIDPWRNVARRTTRQEATNKIFNAIRKNARTPEADY